MGFKDKRVSKLESILTKYEGIAHEPKEDILQIFIDFMEATIEQLDFTIAKDYSADYIINDYVYSLQYGINNILEIAKEDIYTTQVFNDLLEELKTLRNE